MTAHDSPRHPDHTLLLQVPFLNGAAGRCCWARPHAMIAGCIDARGERVCCACIAHGMRSIIRARAASTMQGEASLLQRRDRAAHSCGATASARAPAERERSAPRSASAVLRHPAAAVASARRSRMGGVDAVRSQGGSAPLQRLPAALTRSAHACAHGARRGVPGSASASARV